MKNLAADAAIEFVTKSILKACDRTLAMPTAWELSGLI